MTTVVKRRFGYDDSLDVFGIHGAAGTLGALLTGVFATLTVNPVFKDGSGVALPVGAIDGNAHQVINQAIAVGLAWLIAAAGTTVILKLVDLSIGLRVSDSEETVGLDLTQHGELAYAHEFQTYSVINRDSPSEITAVSENPLSSLAQSGALNEAGD